MNKNNHVVMIDIEEGFERIINGSKFRNEASII